MDKLDQYVWTGNEAPDFDQALADTYVGKYILIGITSLDHQRNFLDQQQIHGIVQSASPAGILISLKGSREGEMWNMPPSQDAIGPANPGSYHLRSTGETVENPDLLATWTLTKSPIQFKNPNVETE